MSRHFTGLLLLFALIASSSFEKAKGDLIINGDFESGNTGFASQLVFSPGWNSGDGQYTVTDNPQSWNGNFFPIPDHTSGTGSMLAVNGATTADLYVWQQSVSVSPNVDYEFSSWITTLYVTAFFTSVAELTVEINGIQLGLAFTAPSVTGTWDNWTANWNSGLATTADIRIFNLNLDDFANDFAIDDISFSASAIPEPSSLVLVSLGAVGLISRRRRRS